MNELKTKILKQLLALQADRIEELLRYQSDLSDALHSESKSTAGDKHDTSRAMIHLEQEKLQHQFQELQLQLQRLREINELNPLTQANFGALVETTSDLFLLGASLGKQVVDGRAIYCIGMEAPIAQAMLNKAIADQLLFNGKLTEILAIS
ncbi:MAG: hypothetical protein P8O07_04935 [Crocinitomicaceae bacterium]|nr:hypothetical protein [Crocinitomicaceae bacterium]